jgi:aromatic ring-cleaving dioxygenase
MTMADEQAFPTGDPERIRAYHAHVYYDAASRETAARLREHILENFADIRIGRWRDFPVGPHPRWSYQVAFDAALFAEIVPWLMVRRGGLAILVHPDTGAAYDDHAHYPLWLGEKLDLDLEVLN